MSHTLAHSSYCMLLNVLFAGRAPPNSKLTILSHLTHTHSEVKHEYQTLRRINGCHSAFLLPLFASSNSSMLLLLLLVQRMSSLSSLVIQQRTKVSLFLFSLLFCLSLFRSKLDHLFAQATATQTILPNLPCSLCVFVQHTLAAFHLLLLLLLLTHKQTCGTWSNKLDQQKGIFLAAQAISILYFFIFFYFLFFL